MEKLFSEFKTTNADDWKQQIIKDLKGGDFAKLIWHNPNGFNINPFYTAEDLKEKREPAFTQPDWEICSKIVVSNERTANAYALKALEGGASSLIFALTKKTDLTVLLSGISVEHIELNFELEYPDEDFIANFNSYLSEKGISMKSMKGSICFDAINFLIDTGLNPEFRVQNCELTRNGVNASIYQNAGATQSFELACAIAHAHEYLVRQLQNDQEQKFRFTMAVGSDFFGEIAKLRALRKLWAMIAAEYGINNEIIIHCETSLLNKSPLDVNNNMLRTTTEGMSAVIGGCNSLTINPYNSGFESTNDFSERMARNQQLIFKGESYLDKVADIGAGSYYIENLTDEIASKAWEEFKAIESKGGFLNCLQSNYIQTKISEQSEKLVKEFKEGHLVLVGVNKFQNPKEKQEQRSKSKENDSLIKPLRLSDHLVKENA